MFAFEDESEFYAYMPDGLHPNRRGYELWSRCLMRGLAAIVHDHPGTTTIKERQKETIDPIEW